MSWNFQQISDEPAILEVLKKKGYVLDYAIYLDRQMTRRKQAHFVEDKEGRMVFFSSEFYEVLNWLVEKEAKCVLAEARKDFFVLFIDHIKNLGE